MPPLVIAEENVTLLPEQILLALALILMVGVTFGLTVTLMLLLVFVGGMAHTALLVTVQVMTSLLTKLLTL